MKLLKFSILFQASIVIQASPGTDPTFFNNLPFFNNLVDVDASVDFNWNSPSWGQEYIYKVRCSITSYNATNNFT